jgi:hypothetical protein
MKYERLPIRSVLDGVGVGVPLSFSLRMIVLE